MTFTAHYERYQSNEAEECDTLDEAVAFLAFGWAAGDLSQRHIAGPDGDIVLEGPALFDQMRALIGA